MPKFEMMIRYMEPHELENIADNMEDVLRYDDTDYMDWSVVKSVAKRYCSDRQYKAILLRGEYGMTYEDIGAALLISKSGAEQLTKRAIGKIQEVFARYIKSRG